MKEKFQYLVNIYLNAPKSESLTSLPAFLGHGALKVSKEESNVSCDSSSSLIPLLNESPPCTNVVDGKIEDPIIDTISCPSSPHNQNLNSCLNIESNIIYDIASSKYISYSLSAYSL